jgi:hypothetical protein
MSAAAAAGGGNNYEGEFHFKLSEECNAIDIKEPPNIKLEMKDKEGGTKSIVSFKVTVKNASTEEEALEIARSKEACGYFSCVLWKTSWILPYRWSDYSKTSSSSSSSLRQKKHRICNLHNQIRQGFWKATRPEQRQYCPSYKHA